MTKLTLKQFARKGGFARWKGKTKKERKELMKKVWGAKKALQDKEK